MQSRSFVTIESGVSLRYTCFWLWRNQIAAADLVSHILLARGCLTTSLRKYKLSDVTPLEVRGLSIDCAQDPSHQRLASASTIWQARGYAPGDDCRAGPHDGIERLVGARIIYSIRAAWEPYSQDAHILGACTGIAFRTCCLQVAVSLTPSAQTRDLLLLRTPLIAMSNLTQGKIPVYKRTTANASVLVLSVSPRCCGE